MYVFAIAEAKKSKIVWHKIPRQLVNLKVIFLVGIILRRRLWFEPVVKSDCPTFYCTSPIGATLPLLILYGPNLASGTSSK